MFDLFELLSLGSGEMMFGIMVYKVVLSWLRLSRFLLGYMEGLELGSVDMVKY